jgi:hypothetical protein
MWSTNLADVAAVGGCRGQTSLAGHFAGQRWHFHPRRRWLCRGGRQGFPSAGGFLFCFHTCLAWEAHSCHPASPLSLLACLPCLPFTSPSPFYLSQTCTTSHSTTPAGCSLPFASHLGCRCRIHRCYRCNRFVALHHWLPIPPDSGF